MPMMYLFCGLIEDFDLHIHQDEALRSVNVCIGAYMPSSSIMIAAECLTNVIEFIFSQFYEVETHS